MVAVIRHGLGGMYYLAFDGASGRIVDSAPLMEEIAGVVRLKYPAYFSRPDAPDPFAWIGTMEGQDAYSAQQEKVPED